MIIDKNVPMPNKRLRNISKTMKDMEVGDSFVIDTKKNNIPYQYAKRHNLTIVTSKISETETRVWRTE